MLSRVIAAAVTLVPLASAAFAEVANLCNCRPGGVFVLAGEQLDKLLGDQMGPVSSMPFPFLPRSASSLQTRVKAAKSQFDAWLKIAESSNWRTPEGVKKAHPKASILKAGRVVFNIKGTDFRLIVLIQYQAGVLSIRFIGTHEEYDRIDAEKV